MAVDAEPPAVLVLAFGGPERSEEIRPFLRRVLAGRPVPPERFEEVAHHYELIGGRSPLGEITREQTGLLTGRLGIDAGRVRIGMRHSEPFIEDALRELVSAGCTEAVGLILAAHESPASHGRYREAVERAREVIGAGAPHVRYAREFHTHPGFVTAHAEHIRTAITELPEASRDAAPLIFTAHSIPTAVAERSPYVEQLTRSAELVRAALDDDRPTRIAYQSRSGSPRDPWLEPDINDVLREETRHGTGAVVVSPLGFVCDHVEVLYDLDVEAAATAQELGIAFARARSPNAHPGFIEALADAVRAAP